MKGAKWVWKNLLTAKTTFFLLILSHKVTISLLRRIGKQLQPVEWAAGELPDNFSLVKRVGNNNNKKFVYAGLFAAIRQCSEFAFGPVGHCFLCCSQFFSAVMWSLRFPFFWSWVCHYMRYTMLRTRPVNMFLDGRPFDYVFQFRRPTRLKEGPALHYVYRRVYIFKWKAQN